MNAKFLEQKFLKFVTGYLEENNLLKLNSWLESNVREMLNLQQNKSDCRIITGPLKYNFEHCSRNHVVVDKYLNLSELLKRMLLQPLKREK